MPRSVAIWTVALWAVALLAAVTLLALPHDAFTPSGSGADVHRAPRTLPAGLARAIHAALGPGPVALGRAPLVAGIEPVAHGWDARAPLESLQGQIGPDGTVIARLDGMTAASLRPTGVSWGSKHTLLSVRHSSLHHGRLVQQLGAATATYQVTKGGLEQTFTVDRPLSKDGQLSLELSSAASSWRAIRGGSAIVPGGARYGRLDYAGLRATDARRRALRAHFVIGADGSVRIVVDTRTAAYPVTIDPTWSTTSTPTATLTSSSGSVVFGDAVALSSDGTTALVGDYDANSDKGAAFVFHVSSEGSWKTTSEPAATLTNGSGSDGDDFGQAVALSPDGTTALIGAISVNSDTGAAYLFQVSSESSWKTTSDPTATLTNGSGSGGDSFGYSVALSQDGTTALIGAALAGDAGEAYVFHVSSSWADSSMPTATLVGPNSSFAFGGSVALSADGSTALVGAFGNDAVTAADSPPGAAYVFNVPSAAAWGSTTPSSATLTSSSSSNGDNFGGSVALSSGGTTALIGAPSKAYIFQASGEGAWASSDNPTSTLTDSGGGGEPAALSPDGTAAVIGDDEVGAQQGAAYIFQASNGSWPSSSKPDATLTDGSGSQDLGIGGGSISSDDATAIVGGGGAAYIFSASGSSGSTSTCTVTTTADTGAGSLRAAITSANAKQCGGVIDFDISGNGVQEIQPATALPAITQPVTIDGTSQPGYSGTPLIQLDGGDVSASNTDGLLLTGGKSTVKGLEVTDWTGAGIELQKGGSNKILSNYVGTDGAGALGNADDGVLVDGGSSGNVIGGTTAAARNVISGNAGPGVAISGSGSKNTVEGDYIGTDKTGATPLGNAFGGIYIDKSSPGNTIGGTTAGAGNLLSGNTDGYGVTMESDKNLVEGNYIGTDASGSEAVANEAGVGVGDVLGAAEDNTIGGLVPAARNVISGNAGPGVDVGGKKNILEGNYIGTDTTGGNALGNTADGVDVGGTGNTIGANGAGNVISASGGEGISVGAAKNVIEANHIGTDSTGTKALANALDGIQLVFAAGTIVGGAKPGMGNVISGNAGNGVELDDQGVADKIVVEGNYIGTDASGGSPLGNGGDGVMIDGSDADTIGGSAAGAGNVISGNAQNGVELNATEEPTSKTAVEGNLIGTDPTRTKSLPNTGDGVLVDNGASSNTIGGTAKGDGNTIANSGTNGVQIDGSFTTGNPIETNSIFDSVSTIGIDLTNGGDGGAAAPSAPAVATAGKSSTVSGMGPDGARVEVFSNPSCSDPEGKQFLGSTTASKTGSWSLKVSAIPSGAGVTFTATDTKAGNTSPFSACATSP